MPVEETKVVSSSSVSSRIIAAGIVIAFCYWASTVLVTLLVAVLMAYFLDPVVSMLERIRIPRALGSLLIVLLTVVSVVVLQFGLVLAEMAYCGTRVANSCSAEPRRTR